MVEQQDELPVATSEQKAFIDDRRIIHDFFHQIQTLVNPKADIRYRIMAGASVYGYGQNSQVQIDRFNPFITDLVETFRAKENPYLQYIVSVIINEILAEHRKGLQAVTENYKTPHIQCLNSRRKIEEDELPEATAIVRQAPHYSAFLDMHPQHRLLSVDWAPTNWRRLSQFVNKIAAEHDYTHIATVIHPDSQDSLSEFIEEGNANELAELIQQISLASRGEDKEKYAVAYLDFLKIHCSEQGGLQPLCLGVPSHIPTDGGTAYEQYIATLSKALDDPEAKILFINHLLPLRGVYGKQDRYHGKFPCFSIPKLMAERYGSDAVLSVIGTTDDYEKSGGRGLKHLYDQQDPPPINKAIVPEGPFEHLSFQGPILNDQHFDSLFIIGKEDKQDGDSELSHAPILNDPDLLPIPDSGSSDCRVKKKKKKKRRFRFAKCPKLKKRRKLRRPGYVDIPLRPMRKFKPRRRKMKPRADQYTSAK